MTPTNDGVRVWCDVSLIVVVFSIPDRMRDDDGGFVAACEFEFDRLTPRARFLPRYRVFDDATEQAVKTMQTQYGLPMTGTWGALERMMLRKCGFIPIRRAWMRWRQPRRRVLRAP